MGRGIDAVAWLVLSCAALACAQAGGSGPTGAGDGGEGGADGSVGADADANDANDSDGEGSAAEVDAETARDCDRACDAPPLASCSLEPQGDGGTEATCQLTVFEPDGRCESGNCSYPSVEQSCEFGCDVDAGACQEAPAFCAGIACGTAHECGGACEHGSGCCTARTYTRSSGFTYNGFTLCCDTDDRATGVVDCGDGDDHWVTPSGESCGVAYEGSDNRGGPCVSLTCDGQECW